MQSSQTNEYIAGLVVLLFAAVVPFALGFVLGAWIF